MKTYEQCSIESDMRIRYLSQEQCVIYKASEFPANERINVGLTLFQRRSRWTDGKPTLIQRLMSAGLV